MPLDNLPSSAYNGAVQVVQAGEVIRRMGNCSEPNSNQVCDNLAWQYFEDYIAAPIRNRLNTFNAATGKYFYEQIRYIVLCKGIPLKIWAQDPYWYKWGANVSLDGLLSVLNTAGNNNPPPLSFYYPNNNSDNRKSNPYYLNYNSILTMEYRFLPNAFSNNQITLSYLVSRLDGETLEDILNMIYKSVNADKSGEGLWVLDGHPTYYQHNIDITNTSTRLIALGFKDTSNTSTIPIFNSNEPVIGYSSQGAHAGYIPLYLQKSLTFDYLNGAIANTFESFNCYSMNPEYRINGQGLISEFVKRRNETEIAGTAGVGHVWEPYAEMVIKNELFFPAYAVGYNLVDAAYLGMPKLIWQNVVIGDPLTRIAEYPVIMVTQDTTINEERFLGRITVPEGKTLTITSPKSRFELFRNSHLKVEGTLVIEVEDFVITNMSKLTANTLTLESGTTITCDKSSGLAISGELNLSEGSSIIAKDQSNVSLYNFSAASHSAIVLQNNSTLTVSNLLSVENGCTFSIGESCKINTKKLEVENGGSVILNGNAVLSILENGYAKLSGSTLSVSNAALVNIPGNVEVKENCNIVFTGSSMLNIDGKLITSAGEEIEFNNTSSLSIKNAVLSEGTKLRFRDQSSFEVKNSANLTAIGTQTAKVIFLFDSPAQDFKMSAFVDEIHLEQCSIYTKISIESDTEIEGTSGNEINFTIKDSYVQNGLSIKPDRRGNIAMLIDNVTFNTSSGNTIEVENIPFLVMKNLIVTGNTETGCFLLAENLDEIKVENSTFNGFNETIDIINSNAVTIKSVTFSNFITSGLKINGTTNSNILDNYINGYNISQNASIGIDLSNVSNGSLNNNYITGCGIGINFANSSPKLLHNFITGNYNNGLYVTTGSNPILSELYLEVNEQTFPLAGYNQIRENGEHSEDEELNAEMYLINDGFISLANGCNTIKDDRETEFPFIKSKILIGGRLSGNETLDVSSTFWGDHFHYGNDPDGRFGEGIYPVLYEPYLNEPCIPVDETMYLVICDSRSEPIDTIYSILQPGILSVENSNYAEAYLLIQNREYNPAILKLNQIIQNNYNGKSAIQAYKMVFSLTSNFNKQMLSTLLSNYQNLLQSITDTTVYKVVNQLIGLIKVKKREYNDAITHFEQIALTNPGTETELYAMIDMATISLLNKDTTNNLGKSRGMTFNDILSYKSYVRKLKEDYKKGNLKISGNTIPTRFELNQNYPNPFNPITTIKYGVKEKSVVKIEVFDILGRKIKTLINEQKEPGFYEVKFDGSSLSSGVYFYRLFTESVGTKGNFVEIRKMMLLK